MVEFSGEQYMTMMRQRDYRSIVALRREHEEELLKRSNPVEFRHLSMALLRAGDIADAIQHFDRLVNAISPKLRGGGDDCELGAAHWAAGDVSKGIDLWRQALRRNYGDGAGNLSPALLLYYAAIRTKDNALQREAATKIADKLKTGWARNWPAPLGRFLLGLASVADIETELSRQHPLRQPDEYCCFDFYRGVRLLESGDEAGAAASFQIAVDRPKQTTWSTEFVLAQHESRNTNRR